jgi:hypothetical protein
MAAPVDALIDTGPLVGFLDKSDQWHDFAVETFPCVNFPAYTCEAVISEAALLWLAETHPGLSILTTDKRDFSRYRLHAATRSLKIIAP